MWSRIYLIPLLQAEEDRDAVRRHYAREKMEQELLGKTAPVYNKDVYVKGTGHGSIPGIADILQFRATDIRSNTGQCNEVETQGKSIVHITEFREYQLRPNTGLQCNAMFLCSSSTGVKSLDPEHTCNLAANLSS